LMDMAGMRAPTASAAAPQKRPMRSLLGKDTLLVPECFRGEE
jgi:hypothetical protein